MPWIFSGQDECLDLRLDGDLELKLSLTLCYSNGASPILEIHAFSTDEAHGGMGDFVLMHTGKRTQSRVSKEKLDDYWLGPYRIREIPEDSTFYYLEEMDDTRKAKSVAGNRLKQFFSRISFDKGREQLQKVIRVRGDEDADARDGEDGEDDGDLEELGDDRDYDEE